MAFGNAAGEVLTGGYRFFSGMVMLKFSDNWDRLRQLWGFILMLGVCIFEWEMEPFDMARNIGFGDLQYCNIVSCISLIHLSQILQL